MTRAADDDRRRELAEERFGRAMAFLAGSSDAPRLARERERTERRVRRAKRRQSIVAIAAAVLIAVVAGTVFVVRDRAVTSENNAAAASQRYYLGEVASERKEWDEALINFDAALAAYEKVPEMRVEIARTHLQRGYARLHNDDSAGSLADFDAAIALLRDRAAGPDLAKAYTDRANALSVQGGDRGAAAAIDGYTTSIRLYRSLSAEPKILADSYYHRGLARARLKQYDAAIADYTLAIEGYRKYDRSPDLGDVFHSRAQADLAKRDIASSIRDYRSAIHADNSLQNGEEFVTVRVDEGNVYAGLAAAEARAGHAGAAASYYCRAMADFQFALDVKRDADTRKKYDDALANVRRAGAACTPLRWDDSPNVRGSAASAYNSYHPVATGFR